MNEDNSVIESSEIEGMSVAEKLRTMEQLWDALSRDSHEVASPAWHGDVLAQRKRRAERGEAKFLTLDQLRARLRSQGAWR
ncbi:MAG: hypothetical protein C5B50_07935 [Verrucomicrobia bacterium]|nr:MAG: hypothetical protein C5B50_07935 [Verrucomicrobiota bacterium]